MERERVGDERKCVERERQECVGVIFTGGKAVAKGLMPDGPVSWVLFLSLSLPLPTDQLSRILMNSSIEHEDLVRPEFGTWGQ